ncbi:RNA-binding protein [Bacillus sp. 03113]|uniref:YlmH family RNA-binding protein n=1 Tax=Bacillus sp. 03113 TaxID=2578211 RepID=UPI0011415769|nr:RNA-binding protein [Bacillus sp. 03113]
MSIYQHFRPEEKEFIDQVIHWKDYVDHKYTPKLTDFLDPREQRIVGMIIGQQNVKWELNGGNPLAERKRALIFPDYYEPNEDDFQISLYEVEYASKFVKVEHPHVLGSLMSLGLTRGKYGDILKNGDRIQFFIAAEVEDYVKMQLDSIGKAKVSLQKISTSDTIISDIIWSETATTVSSLRLDTIVAAIFNLSRQKSQALISQGVVKVNWTNIENPSFECQEDDILSVRGHGRSKLLSIEGRTKKDKWRIIIAKQK